MINHLQHGLKIRAKPPGDPDPDSEPNHKSQAINHVSLIAHSAWHKNGEMKKLAKIWKTKGIQAKSMTTDRNYARRLISTISIIMQNGNESTLAIAKTISKTHIWETMSAVNRNRKTQASACLENAQQLEEKWKVARPSCVCFMYIIIEFTVVYFFLFCFVQYCVTSNCHMPHAICHHPAWQTPKSSCQNAVFHLQTSCLFTWFSFCLACFLSWFVCFRHVANKATMLTENLKNNLKNCIKRIQFVENKMLIFVPFVRTRFCESI